MSAKVEIDERLTNLFHSRRNNVEVPSDTSEHESGDDTSTPYPLEMSWLNQFSAMVPGSAALTKSSEPVSMFEVTSTFVVRRSEIRPFVSSGDLKTIGTIWKKSKKLLTQDCQKQRKAAIRKCIRR